MGGFEYERGHLHCEGVSAAEIVDRYGTPVYVYSSAELRRRVAEFREAFAALDPLICFSVKSCPNTHICRLLREAGCGFDVVSGGELFRVLRAGADAKRVVFAGVGKTEREIREAIATGVGLVNVESQAELEQMIAIAGGAGVTLDAAIRVNPDVDAHSHEYTTTGRKQTKFGIDFDQVPEVFRRFGHSRSVRLRGVHVHLGSPVSDPGVFAQGVGRVLELTEALRGEGFGIDTFDIGGGFAAAYRDGDAPSPADYARVLVPLLRDRGLRFILEPGRAIAANAGVLLARVLRVKRSGGRRFVIVDAAMNDLIRPALYQAYHFVWPVQADGYVPESRGGEQPFEALEVCDIVGPVCECGDFLARERAIPPVRRGELLAVFSAGAYAMSMASQYNSRPRAAEVLVCDGRARLIRRRETCEDLVRPEEEIEPGG